MAKAAKIGLGLIIIAIAVIAALTIAVKLILTPDRLIPLIEKEGREALGRQVTIGGLEMGLFSGIEVKDLEIKEEDPRQEFARIGTFRLRYDLWRLLHKELVITSLEIENPSVTIRRRGGKFNFETLALLAEEGQGKGREAREAEEGPSPSAVPPVSLEIEKFSIKKSKITVIDDSGEIPRTDVVMSIFAKLGMDAATGSLKGSSNYVVDVSMQPKESGQPVKLRLKGDATVTSSTAAIKARLTVQDQGCDIETKAELVGGAPHIVLAIRSQLLDIEPLMALAAAFSGTGEETAEAGRANAATAGHPTKPLASLLPKGLKAEATVQIKQIKYQGLEFKEFHAKAVLKNGKLTMNKGVSIENGQIAVRQTADLNQSTPPFELSIKAHHIDPGEILSRLGKLPYVRGNGALDLECNGRGLAWDVIKKDLSCKGTYAIKDGRLYSSPVTKAVAGLLGLPSLDAPYFDELGGNIKIQEGRVLSSLKMDAKEVGLLGNGKIGLDGTIDYPINVFLSPEMAAKASKRLPLVAHLPERDGKKVVPLQIKGSLKSPKVSISSKGARDAAEQAIGKEIQKRLLKGGSKDKDKGKGNDAGSQAQELFKGFMGGGQK